MTTLRQLREELEGLAGKATPGFWCALWKDDGDSGYPRNKPQAFEFVGVPTSGDILLGCEATVIAGVSVEKGSQRQALAHSDIDLIARMHQNLPLLLAIVEMAEAASAAFPQKNGDWVKVQDCPDIGLFGGERITAFNAARAKVDGLMGQTGAGS